MNMYIFHKALLTFHTVILAIFTSLLLLQVFNSMEWRMEHDTPLLHYAGFLIDKHNLVPYRDIFETSMPATFAFHYIIGTSLGYGDLAFRLVDLVLLCALLVATFLFMSRFGRLPALWAVVLFGIVYLGKGQTMSLQRDYIGILPIAFALLTIPVRQGANVHLARFALVGLLFSLSALVKPHLGIGLPVVFGTLLSFRWNFSNKYLYDLLVCGVVCAVSFLIPLFTTAAWLAANSALTPFIDIIFQYLPMHSAMTGSHQNLTGMSHAMYLIKMTFKLGGYGALFLCSLFAYYRISIFKNLDKSITMSLICLFLCTTAYAIYPTIAGKFWGYHYMPFAYFCAISAALCLYAWPDSNESNALPKLRKALPFVIFLVAVSLQVALPARVNRVLFELQTGSEVHAPKGGRVDEIASWLKSRLQPGDTVQPLDWTGGAIHAMLLSEAKLATRFMYDYHFYHHISSTYTQRLRRVFIEELLKAKPRFIIEIHTGKPWVSGVDSTREFPELRMFLDNYYTIAFNGEGFFIYEQEIGTHSNTAQQVAPADASSSRR